MTTKLEEKFMKTFGIEKREFRQCMWQVTTCQLPMNECNTDCAYWETYKTDYPPITDNILLELVCILIKCYKEYGCYYDLSAKDIKTLKEEIIEDCIDYADDIKDDIRKLFEE